MRAAVAAACILSLATGALAGRWDGPGRNRPSTDPRPQGRPEARAGEDGPLGESPVPSEPLAIIGADVHPVTGPTVPGGTLLLRDGRIEAILDADSAARRLRRFDGRAIDATGLHAYPGLVAAGADGLGVDSAWYQGAAADGLTRRVVDSHDAWSEGLRWASSAGITSAFVFASPFGADKALVATGSVLKVSPGEPRGVLVEDAAGVVARSRLLGTAGVDELRRAIEKAEQWRDTPEKDRRPNPTHERILDVAAGRVPVFVPASTKAQVLTTLRLAEELGFRPVLYHSAEAWVLADRLADAGIPVVQHVRTSWGKARDDRRRELPGGWRFDAAARLRRAGVEVAVLPLYDAVLTWGVAGRDLTNLPLEAAFAQRGGLTPQEALESITIVPARLLGVDDRVGSLERGKDADVILVDGDLLDYRSVVRTVIVNGNVVFEPEKDRTWDEVFAVREAPESDASPSLQ